MPKFLFILLIPLWCAVSPKTYIPDSKRAADVRTKIWPQLQKQLTSMGLKDDQPVFIRIFKEPGILEIWVKSGKEYKLFKTYLVCAYSGGLGTKTRDRDGKCPEGYYTIVPTQLNPVSTYHLAMNIGYPNIYDQQHGYTGNSIMIHGYCASIGCYAMTDPMIEEIYTMVYEAFQHGQKSVPVDIFPFKLTNQNIDSHSAYRTYIRFWENLKRGYDIFEKTHVPPIVTIANKNYDFR